MKINPTNPSMSLIPFYESDYSDESWYILEVLSFTSYVFSTIASPQHMHVDSPSRRASTLM